MTQTVQIVLIICITVIALAIIGTFYDNDKPTDEDGTDWKSRYGKY